MKKSLLIISMLATSLLGAAQESSAVYENYPDPLAGSDYVLAESYNMTGSEIALLTEQLADKTVRRQIVRNGKLYVLALDAENEPYIYLADIETGIVAELDKAAVEMGVNGRLKISDITLTADNVLVASGLSKVHHTDAVATEDGEERGKVNVYKWSKNEITGFPETCELWFTTDYACYFNRSLLGKATTYSGTSENGVLSLTCHHATAVTSVGQRYAQVTIAEGEYNSIIRIDSWKTVPNETYFYCDVLSNNGDFDVTVSPLGNNNYVTDGNLVAPFEWTAEGDNSEPTILGRNELINVASNHANYFKYNKKSVMVTPDINEDGKVAGVLAYDITEGFDKAVKIDITGADIEATDYTFTSAHGEVNASNASIDLFLVVDGKVNKFSAPGITVGIDNIATEENAPVEYFNLQGVKVANPTNGVFIKKQGGKTSKLVL